MRLSKHAILYVPLLLICAFRVFLYFKSGEYSRAIDHVFLGGFASLTYIFMNQGDDQYELIKKQREIINQYIEKSK